MPEAMDHSRSPRRQAAARVWNAALAWLRVLWVCRVGAVSAGLGLALFALASPARDLFMEAHDYNLYWTGFFSMVLAWALIVHYTGRKVLEQQAWGASGTALPIGGHTLATLIERYQLPAAWVPRLLGLACLGAVWLGIRGAAEDLKNAQQPLHLSDPNRLLWFLAAATAAYLAYVVLHRRLVDAKADHESWGEYLRNFLKGERRGLLTEPSPFWFFALATWAGRRARSKVSWDIVAVLLLLVLAVVWIAAVIWPRSVELFAPRALFVVLILGLPVSLLAYLSVLSHYLRLPLIAGSVLVLALLTGTFAPRFHDLRAAEQRTTARLELKEAVDRWVRANCRLGPDAAPRSCDAQPVILASAGGASRAAFFTASVVGDILDNRRVDLKNSLFAISGVSGGAVGAAVIRAALDDAGQDGGAPCRTVGSSWFRSLVVSKPYNWRSCLQALTAGDFLSRPFVGLAFRDLFGFPFHHFGMPDRAVLLESAFEDHYRALVGADRDAGRGLARAIGEFPNGADRWVPLLVLNTTSILDGRRSIVSDLVTYACNGDTVVPLFPGAVDLLDMLGAGRSCAGGRPSAQANAPTVSLSSGAAASARFPIISPHAGISKRAKVDDQGKEVDCREAEAGCEWIEIDRVVDGGYFENDGLTSARQLAEAVHALKPDLQPIILHVTNNPTSESVGEPDVAPRSGRQWEWYGAYVAPLSALVVTRDGHAAEAIKAANASPAVRRVLSFQVSATVPPHYEPETCTLAGEQNSDSGQYTAAGIKNLSMSWWLSSAVQAYLDSQVCYDANLRSYKELVRLTGMGGGR